LYFSKNPQYFQNPVPQEDQQSARLNKSILAFFAGFIFTRPRGIFFIIVRLMTAGRDSRVSTTAKFLASICWLEFLMNVSRYPAAVFTKYSQSVWRINSTAGLTPQGCSIWTAAATPWWWTEGLKFDIFYSNCLTKALMFSLFIGESSRRTVSTDKTHFIFKAGLTPQHVSGINNYPRSYSLNDPQTLFQDILPFGSSNKQISLWMQYLSSDLSFLLHQMASAFMLKLCIRGRFAMPCVSVLSSTQSSTFPEVRGIGKTK